MNRAIWAFSNYTNLQVSERFFTGKCRMTPFQLFASANQRYQTRRPLNESSLDLGNAIWMVANQRCLPSTMRLTSTGLQTVPKRSETKTSRVSKSTRRQSDRKTRREQRKSRQNKQRRTIQNRRRIQNKRSQRKSRTQKSQ